MHRYLNPSGWKIRAMDVSRLWYGVGTIQVNRGVPLKYPPVRSATPVNGYPSRENRCPNGCPPARARIRPGLVRAFDDSPSIETTPSLTGGRMGRPIPVPVATRTGGCGDTGDPGALEAPNDP